MEKKKNAEPVTLFSNDTIEIIDNGADYFTKNALMYGLDGTDFPGDIEDVQRDVIQKLDLEGRAIPDAEGDLTLVEELPQKTSLKSFQASSPILMQEWTPSITPFIKPSGMRSMRVNIISTMSSRIVMSILQVFSMNRVS